jgi:hypothetical protein
MKQTKLSQQVVALLAQADGLTASMMTVRASIASHVIGLEMQDAWDLIAREVLPPIAKKYGAKIERTRTGSCKLVKSDGSRHETAYSFMRTLLSATNLIAGAGDTNKNAKRNKLSAVDRLVASFNKLSLREQREFIKALPRNV